MARYVEALERYRGGRLSCLEAAEVLGISERHFRRLRDRYEADGAEGLIDRRRGRASGRRAPVDRIEFVVEQYRTRYWDFTVKHFHEALQAEHGFALSYTWTKAVLQSRGLVAIAPRRSAHRKKRPRRPLPGMMLFQDGSPHAWLAGQAPLDLIVTLDDATSAIYSVFLVEEEGTASSFRGLAEVISQHGLFSSFYTDRGSHYFTTPKAGGKVDKGQPTQVGRALAELRHRAHPVLQPGSPRAAWSGYSGRCSSACRRCCACTASPRSRRPTGISPRPTWPAHNARFAVAAAEQGSAFVPFAASLRDILCVKHERVVGRDNCVRYEGRVVADPASSGTAITSSR